MRDFSSPSRSTHLNRAVAGDEEWWWKPAVLSSSLAAVVFIHWLILR